MSEKTPVHVGFYCTRCGNTQHAPGDLPRKVEAAEEIGKPWDAVMSLSPGCWKCAKPIAGKPEKQ